MLSHGVILTITVLVCGAASDPLRQDETQQKRSRQHRCRRRRLNRRSKSWQWMEALVFFNFIYIFYYFLFSCFQCVFDLNAGPRPTRTSSTLYLYVSQPRYPDWWFVWLRFGPGSKVPLQSWNDLFVSPPPKSKVAQSSASSASVSSIGAGS